MNTEEMDEDREEDQGSNTEMREAQVEGWMDTTRPHPGMQDEETTTTDQHQDQGKEAEGKYFATDANGTVITWPPNAL